MEQLHYFESIFRVIIHFSILIVECVGVVVLLIACAKSVYGYFTRAPHVRLMLAQGIALSLEFKLGGEVLRTVTAREWNELTILGAVVLLRIAMTILIHWEIKNEENRLSEMLE